MLSGTSTKHVDAAEQARFMSLTDEQQKLEIWLNTRETNGVVAELLLWKEEINPKVNKHERYAYIIAVLFALLVVGTPFLLYLLEHVRWEG